MNERIEIVEGVSIRHYPKWLTRTGKPKVVTPIKFLGYKTTPNGSARTRYLEGQPYVAEKWLCIIDEETGKTAELLFPVEKAVVEEVGWDYNKNPISDELPNMHFDKWEYDGSEYRRIPQEHIITEKEEQAMDKLKKIIQMFDNDVISQLAQLRLMMLTTPSMRIKNQLESLKMANNGLNEQLNEMLK